GLLHSHVPRTRSTPAALTRGSARRNVDSSAAPRGPPSTASTSGPASAAHWPIAANDRDPAITAAIPTASSPASGCRRPRFFRGSGTWARRPSRYWLRAAGIGEDVIGGRVSFVAEDGERRNFHRSVRALSAARGHAGRITCRYDIAGHSLNSRLCRVPASRPRHTCLPPADAVALAVRLAVSARRHRAYQYPARSATMMPTTAAPVVIS